MFPLGRGNGPLLSERSGARTVSLMRCEAVVEYLDCQLIFNELLICDVARELIGFARERRGY